MYSGKDFMIDLKKVFDAAKALIEKDYSDFVNAPTEVLDMLDKMEEMSDVYDIYADSILEQMEDLEISNVSVGLDKDYRDATELDFAAIDAFAKENGLKLILKTWRDAEAREQGIADEFGIWGVTLESYINDDYINKIFDIENCINDGGCVEIVLEDSNRDQTAVFINEGDSSWKVVKDGFKDLGIDNEKHIWYCALDNENSTQWADGDWTYEGAVEIAREKDLKYIAYVKMEDTDFTLLKVEPLDLPKDKSSIELD